MSLLSTVGAIFSDLFGIVKEITPDVDKQMELTVRLAQARMDFERTILQQQTTPWIDAIVKLSMAGDQIVKGLLRPLGSFAMAGFAAYCVINAIDIPTWAEPVMTLMGVSPAAWGLSRYFEKRAAIPPYGP